MKNELIKLPTDQVTISDKGRAAAYKWKPGDKPFVQFLAESEISRDKQQIEEPELVDHIEETSAIDPDEKSSKHHIVTGKTGVQLSPNSLTLNIGSRLEFQAPPRMSNLIIRSTTRINMQDGPQSCETQWEIFPNESNDR